MKKNSDEKHKFFLKHVFKENKTHYLYLKEITDFVQINQYGSKRCKQCSRCKKKIYLSERNMFKN